MVVPHEDDGEVTALRRAVGAKTDMELADKLGVRRSAVSKWRARGVPEKYRVLIAQPSQAEIADAVTKAFRIVMFGKPEHSFWLAAALSALPSSIFEQGSETVEARGLRLERAVLDGMNAAMIATGRHLGKEVCEGEDDFRLLVQALRDHCTDDFARIAARRQPPDDAL